MHQLDANSSALSRMQAEIDQHLAAMQAPGLDSEQYQLNQAWLAAVKKANTAQ
ncbi:DUF3087 family protein [Pseudomonas sp.]|uniref:DUF3087 family protein n=1 Tax=Pseudomonas sp. TaxID=306 RepID=UPI002734FE2A|nr:DUF3087 family protein [Pseudomonas sp.]MDP3815862.1 DUF3087 family protein [Pseudomonas sp.]